MTVIRPAGQVLPLQPAQSVQPARPTGASTFASRLDSATARAPSTQAPAQGAIEAERPMTAEELTEALRDISLQQGLMMGQRIMAMGSGAKVDSE